MITTSAVFDHQGRAKKGKLGQIEIRVTIDRKPYYIGTGVRVFKNEWQYDAVVDRSDSDELNKRVRLVKSRADAYINRCLEEGLSVSIASLKKAVWESSRKDDSEAAMLDWMEDQVSQMCLAEGTMKHYTTLLKRMREYGELRGWQDATVENICKFDAWLHGRMVRQSEQDKAAKTKRKKITDSGVHNYHKCLKALFSRAVLYEKMDDNPYDKLRGQFKRGDKENLEYLTEDEMKAFMAQHTMDGTPLAVARDLFVFQMFTGLSYSDAMAFNIKNYKKVDGAWVFNGSRIKTGVPYVSQLLPPVVEVLERYNWTVPQMDNADYNHALKILGAAAGIETRLHSHLARHTFATFMLRNGVRIENVSRMLGHTNITQTQRYAKVMAQSVHEDFDRIKTLIQNQNEKDTILHGSATDGGMPEPAH